MMMQSVTSPVAIVAVEQVGGVTGVNHGVSSVVSIGVAAATGEPVTGAIVATVATVAAAMPARATERELSKKRMVAEIQWTAPMGVVRVEDFRLEPGIP